MAKQFVYLLFVLCYAGKEHFRHPLVPESGGNVLPKEPHATRAREESHFGALYGTV